MRKSLIYTFKLMVVLLTSSNAQQQTLAILPIPGSGITQQETRTLTEKLRYEVEKKKSFTVMQRTDMETLLADQGFDLSKPCTDLSCAITMGQLLSVDMVVTGNISRIDKNFIVNLKLINIGSGSVTRDITENYKVKYQILLKENMALITQHLLDPDAQQNVVIKKKRRPYIPILIISLSTGALAVPGYFVYKKYYSGEPEKRDITVQW